MAVINFVKGEQYYTAEFQINGPVNVHIERAEAGALYFRQRSIDHGSYDLINGANWNNRGDLTIDTAIQGVVYPMWIKIESASEPTLAEMVEGEQSGGGAGTESTMEYVAFNAETDLATYGEVLGTFAYLVKFPTKIETIPLMLTSDETVDDAIAFAIDTGAVVDFMGSRKSIKDLALSLGADISLLPHLTKEQFYNLEA